MRYLNSVYAPNFQARFCGVGQSNQAKRMMWGPGPPPPGHDINAKGRPVVYLTLQYLVFESTIPISEIFPNSMQIIEVCSKPTQYTRASLLKATRCKLNDKIFLQKAPHWPAATHQRASPPGALNSDTHRGSNLRPPARQVKRLPLHHARNGSAPRYAVFKQRVHSQLSNAFLRGWTVGSGKTDDAIVFALKNCLRYDRS